LKYKIKEEIDLKVLSKKLYNKNISINKISLFKNNLY